MSASDRNWDERYLRGDTPWDSGRPSAELVRTLTEWNLPRGRALELGCGTGTNAIYLAQCGFEVAAVDCAAPALAQARAKAAAAGVTVEWIQADVLRFAQQLPPCDFLFDRGCYHCCREVDLAGYLETHRRITRPGSWCLVLAGNPNDGQAGGPPRVPGADLVAEFEPLYRLLVLREFHFEDAGGARGPLGWSCLMQRR
jgi:SAM-dependent methyltransferase